MNTYTDEQMARFAKKFSKNDAEKMQAAREYEMLFADILAAQDAEQAAAQTAFLAHLDAIDAHYAHGDPL